MEEIPDKHIFMMCEALREEARSPLPEGYAVRSCRPEEFPVWKAMPFDDAATARVYDAFMEDYFRTTYRGKEALFYANTMFVCDRADRPVATCLLWKAYGVFNTIQWFKVLKEYEGKGIGRALLSVVMSNLTAADYPVYLHTQPGSYRAIKLYADFGFCLLAGDRLGSRPNEGEACLPILEKLMPAENFRKLRFVQPPPDFQAFMDTVQTVQF